MSVLLVTPTHGRPKAMAALETWVANQTTDDFDWLIVCDDWDGYKFPKGAKVIKRDASDDTLPSICHNMLAAIEHIEKNDKYDKVIILEDDDWYHRQYVQETKRLLDKADLVGWQEDAYYYVLFRKSRRCHNVGHASLAATAFKRSVLPYLRECCERGDVFIDMLLWKGIRQITLVTQPPVSLPDGRTMDVPPVPVSSLVKKFDDKSMLVDNFTGIIHGSGEQPTIINDKRNPNSGNIKDEHPRHVGMKGPWHSGAEGLSTLGHDATSGGGWDPWGTLLRKWVGDEDAKFYLKFTRDPRSPHGTGDTYGPYQEGMLLPLPAADGD